LRVVVPGCVLRVKASMSKRAPLPPVNLRTRGPEAVAVSVADTVVKVSQPPVTGTRTEPRSTGGRA
jgi:hypothetical protein